MACDTEKLDTIARQTIALVRQRIPIVQANLFGSQTQGTAQAASDIDIAAFNPAIDSMPFEEKMKLIVNIEQQIDAPIELHVFSEKSLAAARPTNFFGYLQSQGKPIQ